MGNHLVGVAPPQILPVEHYLTEIGGIQYEQSLGSTRFFKVARAKSEEGVLVVKVLVIPDPSLPLKIYQDEILVMRDRLRDVPNALPFEKATLSEKTGVLIRQYVKDNMYDRISTRPFLSAEEKLWVAFQLLKALDDVHNRGVCHGDIKLENVLITSWSWILVADWAPFKPTYLPEDNPADFSFFFDTSRRRTCYIAPERFIKSAHTVSAPDDSSPELLLSETQQQQSKLTPAMDIFSAGCTLAELFLEGHPPFDFAQLLQFRSGEYSCDEVLEKIENVAVRDMVIHMMQWDPSKRWSASRYLTEHKASIFPQYFYDFLYPYVRNFSTPPLFSLDDKITKLEQDLPKMIDALTECESGDDKVIAPGIEIITSLVTSCIRGLHHCTAKLESLCILQRLSAHLNDDIILHRILPYIFYLVDDFAPRVRAAAVTALTACLCQVRSVPPASAHIFPEYILPNLAHVVTDEAVIVRVAHAENIATLAETAMRFLELTEGNKKNSSEYEMEVKSLHSIIQQNLASILSDPDNSVKQTLLHKDITPLCKFFGRQKANDVLLSHMITFLNDKQDKHLRSAFYESIVDVASYVGWQSSTILKPLLVQGLSDSEELVAVKAVDAMSNFAKLGLLKKHTLYELLKETVPFLLHYNIWIRHAVVGLVCTAARVLHIVDVQCKMAPLLEPFIDHPVIQLDDESVLLEALKPPIPKGVIDLLLRYSELPVALQVMDTRHHMKTSWSPANRHLETSPQLRQLLQRLSAEGLTTEMEYYVLAMKDHLLKINRHSSGARNTDISNGKIELRNDISRCADLSVMDNVDTVLQARRIRKKGMDTARNQEWEHMFGAKSSPHASDESPEKTSIGENELSVTGTSQDKNNAIDNTFIQYRCTPCKLELRELLSVRREQHQHRGGYRQMEYSGRTPSSKWRPKGTLVAHLHEHKSAINRLSWVSGTSLFASASNDGYVSIWDCGRMEGKSLANRSRQAYNRLGGKVVSLTSCCNIKALAAGADNGAIHVIRLDSGSNKLQLVNTRQLDVDDEGCAIDMSYVNVGSTPMLCYATPHGSVQGWDLRQPGTAWRLTANPRQGLLTCFCVDDSYCWLVTGSSSGVLTCWDLRFQLPISQVVHPTGSRIRRVALHPSNPSWTVAAYQFNNEVSMWNMETQAREYTLWASPVPPLSTAQVTSQVTLALHVNGGCENPFVITGGTDMRIRYWDLVKPEDSRMLATSAVDTVLKQHFSYRDRMIEGSCLVCERQRKVSSGNPGEESPKKGLESAPEGHQDCITDLILCKASQWLLVSSSADGVIKLWK